MRFRSIVFALALALVPVLAGAAERLIIDHVTVIEGTDRAPQPDIHTGPGEISVGIMPAQKKK